MRKTKNVIARMIDGALGALAWVGVRLAAMVAPQREVDVYPYWDQGRHWKRLDAWMMAPGWFWLEVGPWTVQVAWKTREEVTAGAP